MGRLILFVNDETFVFHRSLVNKFSSLFRQIFLAAFIWSTLTICGAMLMVQMEIVEYSNAFTDEHDIGY